MPHTKSHPNAECDTNREPIGDTKAERYTNREPIGDTNAECYPESNTVFGTEPQSHTKPESGAHTNAHTKTITHADTDTQPIVYSSARATSLYHDELIVMSSDGFGSPIMLALLALSALFCLAFADAANVMVAKSRAQTGADAAALAAAAEQWRFLGTRGDPQGKARETAHQNGAELVECKCPVRGESATVTVSASVRLRMLAFAKDKVTASATASLKPGELFAEP